MSRMIDAGISVLGLYGYDSELFDLMELPDGVDRTTVISRILMKCANLACMYTNPDFVKVAIQIWSKSKFWTWEKLQKTTEFEYNPIWNKDGTITETHEYGARSVTENRGQRESTSEDKIAGFNSAEYSNADKSTVTDAAAVDSTSEAAREDTITREEKGNIGITTTQQMIKEERDISDFSIYDYIAEDFKKEFCILVY